MQLSDQQEAGLNRLVQLKEEGQRIISMTGPAGTGKTTLIDQLREQFRDVEVCTPTNKAAQVLQAKGIPAKTFFKVFYTLEEKKPGMKPRFIPNNTLPERQLSEGKRAHVNVMIIDEASMVTSRMISQMRGMCNTLILVGDHNQLPPVGDSDAPAGWFAARKHDVALTEIHRQSEGSLILPLANAIREDAGAQKIERMLRHFQCEEDFKFWIDSGAQAIAFTNKERRRINHVARQMLGFDQPVPMLGDEVIVANNYSDELINGTPATVEGFDWVRGNSLAWVDLRDAAGNPHYAPMDMNAFCEDQLPGAQRALEHPEAPDDDEEFLKLQFGYCITAHKAQGSEWDRVAVFDQLGTVRAVAAKDPRAGMSPDEYARRWLYTAVTRARSHLTVMPTWWAQAVVDLEAA